MRLIGRRDETMVVGEAIEGLLLLLLSVVPYGLAPTGLPRL